MVNLDYDPEDIRLSEGLERHYNILSECRWARTTALISKNEDREKLVAKLICNYIKKGKKVRVYTSYQNTYRHLKECLNFYGLPEEDIHKYIDGKNRPNLDTIEESIDADVVILFLVPKENRQIIEKKLSRGKETKTISIGTPNIHGVEETRRREHFKDVPNDSIVSRRIGEEFARTDDVALVFQTDNVLDIRDYEFADADEKANIRKTLFLSRESCEQNYESINQEILNADQEHDDVAALVRRQKELEEYIAFLEGVLAKIGISKEVLLEGFKVYRGLVDKYKIDLNSVDEREKILAETLMTGELAIKLAGIIQRNTSKYCWDEAEKELKKDLSSTLWKKLQDKSKKYLVSAKLTFDAMRGMPDYLRMDYSGVCILLSKVVETELGRYCFEKYKEFIKIVIGLDYRRWPESLTFGSTFKKENVIFHLGDIPSITGVKDLNFYGKDKDFKTFVDYAGQKMMKPQIVNTKLCEFVKKLADDVEYITRKYRNPAAHRNEKSMGEAQACWDFIVGTQLKEFFEKLN